MLERTLNITGPAANDQWGGFNSILSRWLVERQELIRVYCSLTEENLSPAETSERLESFCSVLVDYLSAGHFEIFTEIETEARQLDARSLQLVNALYPYLEQSTEQALWFNDRCEMLRYQEDRFNQIRTELSQLGEALTNRFELEDQLIEYIHNPVSENLQ